MTEIRDELAGLLDDRYRILREIGRGGMATVYLANDERHAREVAVKVLHPELASSVGTSRFLREIEIAARLAHPHILTLIDSGEADGRLYYVMPFVRGESLRDRLRRETRVPLADAVQIIDHVASALAYAHAHNVIHRDIKPENILLADDQAVVADFGIARALQATDETRMTGTGLALGTPAYMSPEQAFDTKVVDARTDVYAMGCVLYEMLAGRQPYESGSVLALLARHVAARPPSVREVDATVPLYVDRAAMRAMAKEPEERFASAKEFAEVLRAQTVVETVGRRRIAVLPPVNLTGDPEQQFLVLGLHEALIGHLGEGDVSVLARTSVLQYQGTDTPAREICRVLSVDAVVESSVFRSGDTVRLQARLIDGYTEEGTRTASCEGSVGEMLAMYQRLALDVVNTIPGQPAPIDATVKERAPASAVVYEKYMRGRVHQQSFNPADLDRAQRYFEDALAIQPDFAPAYAGISLIWGSKTVLGMAPATELGNAWSESARRAVELDPDLAEAHQALAQGYTWYHFDWEKAEASYRRAIELDPDEPQARIFYSHFLGMLDRPAESDAQIARAMQIDPHNPFTQMLFGIQLGLTGRHEEALAQLQKVPPNPLRSFGLSWQHFVSGRLAEGLADYREYFALLGDTEVADAMADDGGSPEAAMIRGAEVLVARSAQRFVKPNNIWHLFGWGGDAQRAIDWLERGEQMRDHEIAYMGALPTSEAIRRDPRFRAFLKRLKLPLRSGLA